MDIREIDKSCSSSLVLISNISWMDVREMIKSVQKIHMGAKPLILGILETIILVNLLSYGRMNLEA